jgi:hypothetical protein
MVISAERPNRGIIDMLGFPVKLSETPVMCAIRHQSLVNVARAYLMNGVNLGINFIIKLSNLYQE